MVVVGRRELATPCLKCRFRCWSCGILCCVIVVVVAVAVVVGGGGGGSGVDVVWCYGRHVVVGFAHTVVPSVNMSGVRSILRAEALGRPHSECSAESGVACAEHLRIPAGAIARPIGSATTRA